MVKPRPRLRETEPPLGQTTFYPRVPLRESAVVFGQGSTLVIRDWGVPEGIAAAEANERRYDAVVLDAVRLHFAGRTVTVREVFDTARVGLLRVKSADLPTAYAVRDVLLILCAMGLASADKSSAEVTFTIRAGREA